MIIKVNSAPYSESIRRRNNHSEKETNSRNGGKLPFFLLILLALGIIFFYVASNDLSEDSPVYIDKDGSVKLAPEREAKLNKELDEIDNAEQYALIAAIDGYFPCFSCPNNMALFLNKGETWKYGVTRKGEKTRYPSGDYGADDLLYVPQFRGDYAECLKEEKRKIYYYPMLPEALKRKIILKRPPGNKNDS